MPVKLLYAMRHCETLFNVQHKSQGWCDSPITPRGEEQCRVAGEELARRGVDFDHYYTSTAERCCDTMELVCQTAFGEVRPYVRKKGLRECGFGILEGKDDFCEPGFTDMRGLVMEACGGEGFDRIRERIVGCMSEIMEQPDAQNVLVVSSGGVLGYFYAATQGPGVERPYPNTNCMIYVYEWDCAGFACKEICRPDFSGIDCGGLDGSGVPNRWVID